MSKRLALLSELAIVNEANEQLALISDNAMQATCPRNLRDMAAPEKQVRRVPWLHWSG
jgi:hypothetical protein